MFNWINISVEWVPREENALAGELSELLNPDDWMLAPKFFDIGDVRDGGFYVWRNV